MESEAQVREQVTRLLIEWRGGDKVALDLLTPIIYEELRRLADRYLRRERHAATMQPTALVHEAYLRLVGQSIPDWQSRSHFFGVAAHLMRQILVDNARRQNAAKRGAGVKKVEFEEAFVVSAGENPGLVALDDALTELAKFDERKSKVIELRFFGGLSVEETAEVLGISVATVGREQRMAQAWLRKEISGEATQ